MKSKPMGRVLLVLAVALLLVPALACRQAEKAVGEYYCPSTPITTRTSPETAPSAACAW